jgi:hypothetical protein
MRKIFSIIVFLICVSADYVRMPTLQDPNNSNAKIKATFIYNFTKYIDWPENYKHGNFVIGVLGTTSFYNDLSTLLIKKSVGNQKFEIKNFSSNEAASSICHILFITGENSFMLPEVIKKLKGKSTLIVTEKPGLTKQGSGINFIVDNNKQRFELNKSNVEKYNLKVSSTLTALAIAIE